ncbi:MAG: efflux RND transporter periplasmic adaptor subunit [Saprospiraceae bacterium]
MALKKSNRKLIIGLVVVFAVLLVFAMIRGKQKPKGLPVTFDTVQLRTIQEKVSASGKIFPEAEIKISSDVSGEIVELYVAEGDSVKKGQLLARINPDTYQSAVERGVAGVNSAKSQETVSQTQIASAQAGIDQVEANLANQKKLHERNRQLLADGVISQADFDASQASLSALQASLRSAQSGLESAKRSSSGSKYNTSSAKASLKEMQTSLQRTSIYAPAAGIISQLNVEKGERVVGTIQMTGTEMMRIADLSSMEVQVEVSENDILRVKLGDAVEIEAEAYLDRIFKGYVTEIANSASNSAGGVAVSLNSDQVTNFIVKIRIDPDSYKDLLKPGRSFPFRPGMSASVDIVTMVEKDVLAVPIQAVTTRDEADSTNLNKSVQEIVFVADHDTAQIIKIKTGVQDNDFIQVKEGLKKGQSIVVGPYNSVARKLKSGSAIHKEEEKKEKEAKEEDE